MAAVAVSTPVPAIPMNPAPAAAAPAQGSAAQQAAAAPNMLRMISTRIKDYAVSTFDQRKPWGEMLDRTSFSKPGNLQEAYSRLRKNAGYFRVNYLIIAALTIAGSFITHPSSLLVLVSLLALWVYVFAIKQGPLVIWDKELSEREKFASMVALSFLVVFFLSNVGTVVMGAVVLSCAIIGMHGAMRVPDDLFLDDTDANAGLLSIFTGPTSVTSAVNNV